MYNSYIHQVDGMNTGQVGLSRKPFWTRLNGYWLTGAKVTEVESLKG